MVKLSVSLTLKNYQKLATLSQTLGLSKSAVINLILADPINSYVLEFAHQVLLNLRQIEQKTKRR